MGGGTAASLQMTQDARDHRLLGDGGNDPERAASAQGTGGHIQGKHAPQQPRPAPARRPQAGLMPIHTLLARRRDDRPAQLAVRRQTARIADEMDARQGHERCQLLQEFQRRECDAGRAVRPRPGERVHEIPMGIFLPDAPAPRHPLPCTESSAPTGPADGLAPGCWRGAKTR